MLDRLPEFIDPLAFAERGREISGKIDLSSLPRLAAVLIDKQGTVAIEMFFSMDGKIAQVHGQLKTVLMLECCNCLQAMSWSVDSEFSLAVVSSFDEVNLLPDHYEPLLLEESRIALKDIVEDELLLCLPDFPRHEAKCGSFEFKVQEQEAEVQIETEQSKSDNPFAILAKLKNSGD